MALMQADAPRVAALLRPTGAALVLAGAVGLFVLLALATGHADELGWRAAVSVLERGVALGIVAIGQTFAILVGSIDLSVANLISVAAVMASYLMQGEPARMLPAAAAVLATGALVGIANGAIVTKLKVNPLIATLGMGLMLQGVLSAAVQDFTGSVPAAFEGLAYGQIGPLPVSVLLLLALTALAGFVLKRTRFGAHVYAVGGNPDGARLAGIQSDRVVVAVHVLCSLAATFAGLFLASRLRSGAPWIGRDGVYDLESVAVVVIGGTVLSGGRGGVGGTLAGVVVFALIDATFNLVGISAFLKQVLRGLIIVVAVAAYAHRTKLHVA